MSVRGWPFFVVAFCACPAPTPGPCPEALDMLVYRATSFPPVGALRTEIEVPVTDAGPAQVSLSVFRDAGLIASVGPARFGDALLPDRQGAVLEYRVDEPGPVKMVFELSCEGRLLDRVEYDDKIYATLRPANEMPRPCALLVALPDGSFDCDGVVVNAQGQPVPGRLAGDSARVLSGGGVELRWVRDPTSVAPEFDGGTSPRIAFSDANSWVAAQDFTMSGDRVAFVADGGLVPLRLPPIFDADQFELCASHSDGQARAVAFCELPFVIAGSPSSNRQFITCDLALEPQEARLENCAAQTGIFVRQEAVSRRVLLRRDTLLFWVDLLDRTRTTQALKLEWWEGVYEVPKGMDLQPTLGGGGDLPFEAVLTREPSLEILALEGWRYPSASSQLVWEVDGGSTRWAPLP